jgi:fructose-specific phosphotransferase system IIC component
MAGSVAYSLAETMGDLAAFLFGLILAAPAIAWMLQVPLERRLPIVTRSHVASAVGGIALTFFATMLIFIVDRGVRPLVPDDYRFGSDFVYVAVALVAIAVGIQVSERHTFSWTRATALLSSALALIAFAKIYDFFEYILK